MKFILLFLFSFFVLANNGIKPHSLEYDLLGSGISIGTEKRELIKNNNIYTYTTNAQTEGFAKIISDYNVYGVSKFSLIDGFKNISFIYKETEDEKVKKDINLNFNNEFLLKNKININEKLVDNLAIFLVLGYDLKNNNPLNYLIANGKKIKKYIFTNLGVEKLNILDKNIEVIKVQANDLTAYLSPAYDYIPVLIKKKKWQYKLKKFSFK